MLLHNHPVLNLKNPKWSYHKSGTVYINYTYVTGKHLIQQSQLLKKKIKIIVTFKKCKLFCFLNFCTKKILIFSQFSFFQSLSTLVSCSWVKVVRAGDIGRLFVFGGVLTSNVTDLHRETYLCSWSLEAGIFHSCFLLNQTAKYIKHSVQGTLRYMKSTLESEKKNCRLP